MRLLGVLSIVLFICGCDMRPPPADGFPTPDEELGFAGSGADEGGEEAQDEETHDAEQQDE